MEMALIVYTPSENELERRFLALLEMTIPKKNFEICRSITELSASLGMPLLKVRVAVLFAATQTEITRILTLGDLMADVKSILVLAEEDKDTMAKVHRLRPRYITWMDCDPIDIVTVVKRMVDLYDAPQGRKRKLPEAPRDEAVIGALPSGE